MSPAKRRLVRECVGRVSLENLAKEEDSLMKFTVKFLKILAVFTLSIFLLPAVTQAQHYTQKNLVSDLLQPSNADGSKVLVDPNLKNPWGLTHSSTTPARPGSPWWVGNNNSGTSTLYDGNGNIIPLVVTVPAPKGSPAGTLSTPTGVVFNGSPTDFPVAPGKQAIFIFATEDGTISGWNPMVNVTNAILKVDNSDKGSANSAVYKGMTSGEIDGKKFLYVANFRSARVEVYDTNFQRVHLGEDAFEDERIREGFAPFNVQNIGGSLFVTYAKQDGPRHDPVGGDGLGFVDIFSTKGEFQGRLEHGDWFNAPWGVVWTPRDFGEFSNTILVGNFRSG